MGYRSEVRAMIYGEPEKLNAFVVQQKLLGSIVFTAFADSLERYKMESWTQAALDAERVQTILEVLEIYGTEWKWYDAYEDVQAWMSMMRAAPEAGLNYEFVRVGEESNDTERESGGDNEESWLSTSTQITQYFYSYERMEEADDEAVHGGPDAESSVLGGSGE